jgi:3-oxoacyl-[acyl-carrier protein] reductase
MNQSLNGRVAVVTGAGRGVGLEAVRLLALDGARVVLNDLDADEAHAAVEQLRGEGAEVVALPGDVTDPMFADQLLATALAEFGDLHIVVNNAGYILNSSLIKHTDENWAAMMDVHATAPFRILRAVGSYFRSASKRESNAVCRKVVNVSSISGYHGAALQLSYSAAKAALIGMTRSISKEWGRYNVTVNCVALGYIATRLNSAVVGEFTQVAVGERTMTVGVDLETRELIEKLTPLGRFGTPAEAAGAIYLLCRSESDFVSGQVLGVNGGLVY